MRRKILDQLVNWKLSKDRKPLILEGARQVGKTYVLEHEFGEQYFDNILKIDFSNAPEQVLQIFDGEIEPHRLISSLEVFYEVEIQPEHTLIFFDEIQDAPRALTSLKYFYEDAPEYCVVAAGSLLGVFLGQADTADSTSRASFPVGKVKTLRMEPMDFEEFLWAMGKTRLAEEVAAHPSDNIYDAKLLDLFREYLVIGGMPEAVASWSTAHNIETVQHIHEDILNDYRNDFHKHSSKSEAIRIRQVFDSLPYQFAKRSDKFLYGVIRESARAREYETAVEWLVNAGLVRRVYRVERGDKIPLRAYTDLSAFKLYFVDLGLFRQLAGIPASVILDKNAIFDEFNGFFAEQFVLQQLAAEQLYYWTGSTSEVDFVMQRDAHIIPIEVKSGENVKSKSLSFYRDKYHPAYALRFSLLPVHCDAGLINITLYKLFAWQSIIRDFTA